MNEATFFGLKKMGFVTEPTPLENWAELAAHWGLDELWVKRDDFTHPVYGGNKVRKLDYLLYEAQFLGYEKVLTYGYAGSNHAVCTSVLAQQMGLEAIVVLGEQAKQPYVWENLLWHEKLGSKILSPDDVFMSKKNPMSWLGPFLKEHPEVYWVPPGGSSSLGNMGYVEVAFELMAQFEELDVEEPMKVYLPCGTQGSAIGLSVGMELVNWKGSLQGIRVVDGGYLTPGRLQQGLLRQMDFVRELSGGEIQGLEPKIELRGEFYGEGYALPTEEGEKALADVAKFTGLRLEGTYTGKALAALRRDALDGRIPEGRALYIQTWHGNQTTLDCGDGSNLPEVYRAYGPEK